MSNFNIKRFAQTRQSQREERQFNTILKSSKMSADFSISKGSLVFFLCALEIALSLAPLDERNRRVGRCLPMQYPKARQPAPTRIALNHDMSIMLKHRQKFLFTLKDHCMYQLRTHRKICTVYNQIS